MENIIFFTIILLGLGIKTYVYILVAIDILGIVIVAIGGILLFVKAIKFLFFPEKINIEGEILDVKEEMVPYMLPNHSFGGMVEVPHCTLKLKSLKGIINIELSRELFQKIRDEFKKAHSHIKLKCSKIFAINEITADEVISQT